MKEIMLKVLIAEQVVLHIPVWYLLMALVNDQRISIDSARLRESRLEVSSRGFGAFSDFTLSLPFPVDEEDDKDA